MNKYAKNNRLKSFIEFFREAIAPKKPVAVKYSAITLNDEEIDQEVYKQYLGGGSEKWDLRGAFQLFFLQTMGMQKSSKVLDVGCGPGRASNHLIAFLEDNNYRGVDYNYDFIKVARTMAEKALLNEKSPVFEVVQNFNFEHIEPVFDYVIAFSVLNHCDAESKKKFFAMVTKPLQEGGKVYISHARWFDESHLKSTGLRFTNQFNADDFDIIKFGWQNKDKVFPIIELARD